MSEARVAVVVMGDIARSPRMLNHARELVAHGFAPVLIGYSGREFQPPAGVRVVALDGGKGAPPGRTGLRFIFSAGLRMSRLFFALRRALLREKPRTILLQNPPSFPTLLAAVFAGKTLRAKAIVDWHNYGFSLLALRTGKLHWLARLSRWYEFRVGRAAGEHMCVSSAMRADLMRHGISATVLYDRPLTLRTHTFDTACIVAVCPAGWTADEDIELLLHALRLLHDSPLTVYITGEGMKRKELEQELQPLRARGILVDTGFLPEDEYWSLIGRADLGLSLHRSSSGLDLAMKVVDLFSASVPVCALDYGGSLPEQIVEGQTGFLFRTAQELANLLARLAAAPETLAPLRHTIGASWSLSWHEEWRRAAMPLFEVKS